MKNKKNIIIKQTSGTLPPCLEMGQLVALLCMLRHSAMQQDNSWKETYTAL